ncbi:MAG TPA: CBS domain-containing protein [Gemmatimonadales bacterium]|nr:CBS domain-containing protein [Gemmatimonadales bacterium]
MRLGELMTAKVVTIRAEEPASRAWSRMRDRRIHHLVVVDGERVVGVLSDRDLGGPDGAARRRGRLVRELMSRPVASATPATTLRQAAGLMRAGPIGSLPVLDDGRLVGIVTATDVLDELGRTEPRARPTGRTSMPDSSTRAPFPDRLPRAFRRQAGRVAPLVPTYIRSRGVALSANDRAYVRRELGAKLGKFAAGLERISVRVDDVNGPRGGVDHLCRIKLVLSGLPSIVVEHQAASLQAAVDGAIARAERTLGRTVRRRRKTPLKRATRRRRASTR